MVRQVATVSRALGAPAGSLFCLFAFVFWVFTVFGICLVLMISFSFFPHVKHAVWKDTVVFLESENHSCVSGKSIVVYPTVVPFGKWKAQLFFSKSKKHKCSSRWSVVVLFGKHLCEKHNCASQKRENHNCASKRWKCRVVLPGYFGFPVLSGCFFFVGFRFFLFCLFFLFLAFSVNKTIQTY